MTNAINFAADGTVVSTAWLKDANDLIYSAKDETGFATVNVRALPYGATGNGTTDDTAAIQAAVTAAGIGATIFFPKGVYKINGTITKLAGQIFRGEGWATTPLTFNVSGGTVLKQFSTSDIPMITQAGVSDAAQVECGGIRDMALVNNVAGATVGTAYLANYARQQVLSNVYIAGFSIGLDLGAQCWQWLVERVRVMDFSKFGCRMSSSSEDNLFNNCSFNSFNLLATCLTMLNQSANNVFTNCYFSDALFGVVMQQGDTNGNGTGTPFPMFATFVGCLVEDIVNAAFMLVTSNQNASNTLHPGLNLVTCRVFNGGAGGVTPNTGQAVVCAQCCSQIRVDHLYEGGFTYGGIFGISAYGFTMAGTALPGPIYWGQDNAFVYGTSRFSATSKIGSVTRIPGDKPLARYTSTATSYTATNFTQIPYTVKVADDYAWANGSGGLIPTRAQTVRFKAQLYTASAPIGRYVVQLRKNGSVLASLCDQEVSTASQPLAFGGEFWDIPNGTSDVYTIVVFSTVSWTLDTTAGNTFFYAELQGT